MELTIIKKYLVFPVNTNAKNKRLSFSGEDRTLYEFNIKLDQYAPDFYAYIDVSRFRGMKIKLTVYPEMEISCRESDIMDIPGLYREPLRPQVHFSTKNGWMNDPNGLIFLDGIYHMFYQYNPAGTHWDNMHWGHAVSDDLIHWEEKDIALFLSDAAGNIFSGSAILDQDNLLGLSKEAAPAALLYYTVTTKPFTQHLAYSTDGFQTIHKYTGNPVLPHIVGGNRDPKVVFCEELNTYIMVLYLMENEYGFLRSANLTDWKLFQRINFPGEAECPDLISLWDGNGRKKWIFMGANDKYIVGEFQKGTFMALQEPMSLHYGSAAYAGQTFSNMPDGRVVRICWDRWDSWHNKSTKFNGQMGIPMELTLESCDGKDYLCANPVKEIERIYSNQLSFDNEKVSVDAEWCISLEDKPYLIKIKGAYTDDVVLDFSIFGCSFAVDFSQNRLLLGEAQMPVAIHRDYLDITLIVDRCSMEFYADGGKAFLSAVDERAICDRNLPWFHISSNGEYYFEQITMYSLNSIWNESIL